MKRKLAALLAASVMITLTAYGTSPEPKPANDQHTEENLTVIEVLETEEAIISGKEAVLGGWNIETEDTLSQEVTDMFEQAMAGLEGVVYEPVKLLAKQVTAGTDYAILCKAAPVYPDAEESYCIVYIFEDLDGNTEITRIQDFIETEEEEMVGGWSGSVDEETAGAAEAALEKALEGLTGAKYEPEAVIASQTVAGTNYLILCKVSTVTLEESISYDLVTVYEDLEGNAEITDLSELEFSAEEPEQ